MNISVFCVGLKHVILFLVILSHNVCCTNCCEVVSALNSSVWKVLVTILCSCDVDAVDGQAGAESTCASAAHCTATQY